jgi:hypothetical protein
MRRTAALFICLGVALAAAAIPTAAAAPANNSDTTSCGTVAGGPCCPGSPAWTCGAGLVCLDYSDVGQTACHPLPGTDAAPCGGLGQACCPDAYHKHTDKPLPAACADGWCDRDAGAVKCSSLSPSDDLAPCGVCRPNPAGCGGVVGAPCCRFSKGGPSDWFTCGPPPTEGGAPPPGSLACDIAVGSEPTCVAAS